MVMRLLLCLFLFAGSYETRAASHLELWYDQPARDWMTEALPIGNGRLAAMVYGGVDEDQLQFNEESLWAGGPGEFDDYRGGNRENAAASLSKVRALVVAGKYEKAHRHANESLTGVWLGSDRHPDGSELYRGFGAYQPFGDIRVRTSGKGAVTKYRRSLDLAKAVAAVEFHRGDVAHERVYYASYPAQMIAAIYHVWISRLRQVL